MQFRQLEYLVALSREKHFTRAADSCAVSQPALSEAIRKLEIELDLPLIVRAHKFEGLTVEGEQIVHWAREILETHKLLKQTATSLRSGVTGALRIGVVPTASAAVADLTGPLCVRHPLITVQLAGDLSSRDIAARIDRFELDGGITYIDDDVALRYQTYPLYRERYTLLTADDPARPRVNRISWRDASALPMCTLHSTMQGRRILDDYLDEQKLLRFSGMDNGHMNSVQSHPLSKK